jgi:hypothetical protein
MSVIIADCRVFLKSEFIFRMHTRAEPLTRVSLLDTTCIAGAGLCKFCRYYLKEDAGRAKESRLCWFLDRTSTLWHDNTQGVFFPGWCVRVQ